MITCFFLKPRSPVWYLGDTPKNLAEVVSCDGNKATIHLLTGPQKGSTIEVSVETLEPNAKLTVDQLEKVRFWERIDQVERSLDGS
jgi:hypothetical protein